MGRYDRTKAAGRQAIDQLPMVRVEQMMKRAAATDRERGTGRVVAAGLEVDYRTDLGRQIVSLRPKGGSWSTWPVRWLVTGAAKQWHVRCSCSRWTSRVYLHQGVLMCVWCTGLLYASTRIHGRLRYLAERRKWWRAGQRQRVVEAALGGDRAARAVLEENGWLPHLTMPADRRTRLAAQGEAIVEHRVLTKSPKKT